MIVVRKIEVSEFRGIRQLEINFKGKNFAICGKNGTGKSGIVDALEFGLTGNISRLAGSGTGGISLKEHAPHVDSRSNPAKAKVRITMFIPSLNKEAVIERSVSDIQNPTIKPASPEVLSILNEISNHPEFVLSRRELIKYVISAPGDRAKEVQALLRLEKVESLRAVLQKICNADKKEIPPLKKQKDEAKEALLSALEIADLSQENVLSTVNKRREQLGLAKLTTLSAKTSFKDGLSVTSDKVNNIIKAPALLSLEALSASLDSYKAIKDNAPIKILQDKIEVLKTNSALLNSLTREKFLREAIAMVEDDFCPVCDTELGIEEIKGIVKTKLEAFDTIIAERKKLENEIEPYANLTGGLVGKIKIIKENAALLTPPIDCKILETFMSRLQLSYTKLTQFLPVDDLLESVKDLGIVPPEVDSLIAKITDTINAIPEPSEQDSARDFLVISQEKLENYRAVSSKLQQAEEKEKTSSTVSDTYGNVVTETLEGLYKDVENNFTELYRFINNDDEAEFTAQLTPSIGKLGFNVDFYGRGYFPPGAYHSEGHQDGMGLCLYLALMKHILGDSFTFAVLDDVLMSVDSGHRREVCRMLKENSPIPNLSLQPTTTYG